MTRRLLGTYLRSIGYLPFGAGDSNEAFWNLTTNGPFSAITIDLELHEFDGEAFVRAVRDTAEDRGCAIVVITAFSIEQATETLHGAPVDAILQKPVTTTQIKHAVGRP